MEIVVRPISSPEDLEKGEDVQMSAWGMGERMTTPKEIMAAMGTNGGLVLGAFDGQAMVGVAMIFPGYLNGKVYLYSHQTGVNKDYQSRGVGYLLKQKQREVALERGFDLISWTFDPIIARNAYFNFGKLGVVARNYYRNYYGKMRDSINYGWPTDRFHCEWYVEPRMLEGIREYARTDVDDAFSAIAKAGEEPYPRCLDWRVDLKVPRAVVEIPRDIVRLKERDQAEALRWREATREVFERYFRGGYSAVGLLRGTREVKYLLMKARLPPNIFSH